MDGWRLKNRDVDAGLFFKCRGKGNIAGTVGNLVIAMFLRTSQISWQG